MHLTQLHSLCATTVYCIQYNTIQHWQKYKHSVGDTVWVPEGLPESPNFVSLCVYVSQHCSHISLKVTACKHFSVTC